MKITIEVSGGAVTNIVATQECSIYLIDHDNMAEKGSVDDAKQAMQPYRITWEEGLDDTPDFDACLDETLYDYQEKARQWENGVEETLLNRDQPHDREEAGTDGCYTV